MAQYGKVAMALSDYRPTVPRPSERELRVQLAAAYRIFDYLDWPLLIYGHITARVPGPERHFLINPYGLMYHEVTASNLVKIDVDGNIVEPSNHPVNPAGFVIHSAIHAARADAHCVMHTHTTAGMAVAAMRDGLKQYDFAGITLYDRVAYHDFEGVTVDVDERSRLVGDLGQRKHMILRNHGLLSCGETVAEAFMNMFTLETACRVQVAAQATGAALISPSNEVCRKHAELLENADKGELAFAALTRLVESRDPSFKD